MESCERFIVILLWCSATDLKELEKKMATLAIRPDERKLLRYVSSELPRMKNLLRLAETVSILEDRELVKRIKKADRDVERGRLLTLSQVLKELGVDEKEI